MRKLVKVALVTALCVLNPLAIPAHADPTCGVNLAAPEVVAAVKSLPPLAGNSAWDTNTHSFDPSSNYNPCSTLSTVIITVLGATGASPDMAMLFHKNTFVGVASSKAYAFTSRNAAKTTDDTVALDFKDDRNVCTACPGPITTVRYQWQGNHAVALDPAPAW
jgi:LppP/LprE lipoprotein